MRGRKHKGVNMTRDETKELLMTINAVYPNFRVKPEQMTFTINAWQTLLEEYPADAVNAALQVYIKTDNNGFAPSVSQIIGAMQNVRHHEELTEGEAWAMVKKAIRDSGYHAKERFDELPPIVQKAVGSPSMLQQWGMTDSDEVNSVIMSNFQRTYRAELSRKEFNDSVSPKLTNIIKGVAEKVSPRIEA